MSTPREGSRATDEGIIVSTCPDVCKTPVGAAVVPIPYSIYAKQDDKDQNTATTVFQTGLRSHKVTSLVTTCKGDEPGTAKGVSSGTVGDVCTPKTYSPLVRIEGQNAVRHDDVWYMNNKNTVGKLVYMKDMQAYADPDPGTTKNIQLAQEVIPFEEFGPLERFGPMERLGPEPGTLPDWMRPIQPKPKPPVEPQPAPGPRPPMPLPNPNLRVSPKCRSETICFNRKQYDKKEYDRQLQLQQDAINAKSPDQNVTDIDNYNPSMRSQALNAQAQAKQQYIDQNMQGFVQQYGQAQWDQHIASLNAIHRLDMVAGGSPTDIAGMGSANVNQSIGPSWNQSDEWAGLGRSRKNKLKDYAKEMAKNHCPMAVVLSTCEPAAPPMSPMEA